ncbi:hypothetical protein Clacol_004883 [Clathrus columnatus]|uniref:DUF647-domain-containing protein n=1 Tax=Clathrus columnatus TaxID=1419009 RepID=A0AAV5ADU2_9AGAM|nr:hypothetical protein Clacol_004883 [Clathrus columnatus]
METQNAFTIYEQDNSGRNIKIYDISFAENRTQNADVSRDLLLQTRLILPPFSKETRYKHYPMDFKNACGCLYASWLSELYYFNYQLFDSLQAFSSSIAGLLASRAVLEGVGVGDANATATNALLITITQDAISRLATILFAWRIGTALEPEAKRYRLLADIFNDTSMILDCLSPALPKSVRIFTLCISSAFRALCGVAAGGAKAALSVHFARANNIGDLNAKDSSQETVIGLLGMLAGSFIVARVTTSTSTWSLLFLLLFIHIMTNYLAVRSVTMLALNRQRATIVYSNFRATRSILDPIQTSKKEYVFARGGKLHDSMGGYIGQCKVEKSIQRLLLDDTTVIPQLLHILSREKYILSFMVHSGTAQLQICLRDDATSADHLKAWIHATELAHRVEERKTVYCSNKDMLDMIDEVYQNISEIFPVFFEGLKTKGWDVGCDFILTKQVNRFRITGSSRSSESKKDI